MMEAYQWASLDASPMYWEGGLEALPDLCVWKDLLSALFSDQDNFCLLGLEWNHLLVFSGPGGNGGHMLGQAVISELASRTGLPEEEIGILDFLPGDFPEGISAETAREMIETAFDLTEAPPCRFLVFHDMDRYSCLNVIFSALYEGINDEYEEDYPHPVVLLYVEEEDRLPRTLLGKALVIRTAMPEEEERSAYLDSLLDWTGLTREDEEQIKTNCSIMLEGITVEELAKETEKLSYSQLDNYVRYLRISGLRNMKKQNSVRLICKREEALRCLKLVKKSEPLPAIPIIQTVQLPASTAISEKKEKDNTDRALLLAGKDKLTFDESLELIQLTPSH